MWLWNKLANPWWIEANEETLRQYAGHRLVIIDQPGRKRSRLEVACKSRQCARELSKNFGGRLEKLPGDWLTRFENKRRSKLLKVGKRLVISDVEGTSASRASQPQAPSHLVIPAGVAFGTGEHVTTAMCLRMLEEITRHMKAGWSVADIGTGSGVLALAAKCFAAGRVVAADFDPMAVSTARANASLNRIDGIDFRQVDARQWSPRAKFDIVMANLFSELLLEVLPKLKAKLRSNGRLILSGILRFQERELMQELRANKFMILQVRRRGKWTALLCSGGGL